MDFGFVELVTALALLESGSEFTPGPAGPGNRMITWYLEPRLWKRRYVSHSSISLELAVCVAEQQRQQPREERRSVLGSSIQRHVRWRWIFGTNLLRTVCRALRRSLAAKYLVSRLSSQWLRSRQHQHVVSHATPSNFKTLHPSYQTTRGTRRTFP